MLSRLHRMNDAAVLRELAPVAERLFERHLSQTREWFPHELVPWELGPSVRPDVPWDASESPLPDAVRSALYVNLLTEDNLPYYLRDVDRMFGREGGVWAAWVRRWTAEEGRHATVIREYLTLTRAVCPVELERGRMAQMSSGEVPEPPTAMRGFAYLAIQELATRISHLNTGKQLLDRHGREIMKRVAVDENYHHLFYRDAAAAAFDLEPSEMMVALEAELIGFSMPGTGIPNFREHSKAISRAGIYDFRAHHEQILVPLVLRHWAVADRSGLTPEAERAQASIVDHVEKVGRVASRLSERAAEASSVSTV
jgi:acyl-[acyl-carrier-protein] desaturase